MKYSEFTTLTDEQLVHRELDLERILLTHQLRHRMGRLDNTSLLRAARRDIARAQTAISTRERDAGLLPGTLRGRHATSFTPSAVAEATEAGGGFLKGLLDTQEAAE